MNINCGSGVSAGRAQKLEHAFRHLRPDILLLQELSLRPTAAERLGHVLRECGLDSFVVPSAGRLGYGSAIASRWVTKPLPPVAGAPFPELLMGAEVAASKAPLRVFSVHMPNGSNHGWKKVESFEAMLNHLSQHVGAEVVVGGDFNEPVAVLPSGEFCSVAGTPGTSGVSAEGQWTRREKPVPGGGAEAAARRSFPRSRWQAAVVGLLQGRRAEGGLVHAHEHIHGPGAVVTHVNARAGTERFFDHILVSSGLKILDSGYEHSVRASPNRATDHSAAWAVLQES